MDNIPFIIGEKVPIEHLGFSFAAEVIEISKRQMPSKKYEVILRIVAELQEEKE
jgi:hypothetical protein